MYRKHFALTRHPFDKDLAADDLFESASLAELSARLRHLVDVRGIGLVTGDSGSGKTTTCRRLVAVSAPARERRNLTRWAVRDRSTSSLPAAALTT